MMTKGKCQQYLLLPNRNGNVTSRMLRQQVRRIIFKIYNHQELFMVVLVAFYF